jgi:flagellar P-ring protein precursor FlgI
MKKIIFLLLLSIIYSQQTITQTASEVRIKNLTYVEDTGKKQLIGYGLVVGLDGTGDRATGTQGAIFTVQTISNMLENFGITVPNQRLRTRNVAAVMVTAELPSWGMIGSQFDVSVASLGDATSLQGGILLMAPLKAGDNPSKIWGMAQGPISIGGYNADSGGGDQIKKNHALTGRVPNGASLIAEPDNIDYVSTKKLRFVLHNPDYNTAVTIRSSMESTGGVNATVLSSGLIEVLLNEDELNNNPNYVPNLISDLQDINTQAYSEARVIINERTGTVVAGGDVILEPVMVSHGSLVIQIKEEEENAMQINQTGPGTTTVAAGTPATTTNTTAEATETVQPVEYFRKSTSVQELANTLNGGMVLSPRDIIAIFQAIDQAGALRAKLIII